MRDHVITNPKRKAQVMLDIETLGCEPGCVVLEVAAIEFHPETGATMQEFHIQLGIPAQQDDGFRIDHDTLAWHEKRGLLAGKWEGEYYEYAYFAICHWLKSIPIEDLWMKGTDFDVPVLKRLGEDSTVEWPIPYYASRDLRTLMKVAGVKRPATTVAHRALDDCRQQISDLMECRRILGLISREEAAA